MIFSSGRGWFLPPTKIFSMKLIGSPSCYVKYAHVPPPPRKWFKHFSTKVYRVSKFENFNFHPRGQSKSKYIVHEHFLPCNAQVESVKTISSSPCSLKLVTMFLLLASNFCNLCTLSQTYLCGDVDLLTRDSTLPNSRTNLLLIPEKIMMVYALVNCIPATPREVVKSQDSVQHAGDAIRPDHGRLERGQKESLQAEFIVPLAASPGSLACPTDSKS